MPRYFFDTSIGESRSPDETGLEYPDVPTAVREARRSLPELVAEALRRQAQRCAVTIRDEGGMLAGRVFATIGEEAAVPERHDTSTILEHRTRES